MKYLSCADTAKLIRNELKAKFSGVKFSVRSETYAGGASIRIYWTNGPTSKEVERITNSFEGKGFDGMIDLAYYKTSYILPSGEVCRAKIEGTEGSRGSVEGQEFTKPEGAEEVHMGADYIFCERMISENYLREAAEKIALENGIDPATIQIEVSEYTGAWVKEPHDIWIYNAYFPAVVRNWFSNVNLM